MQVPSLSWFQERLRQLQGKLSLKSPDETVATAALAALFDIFYYQFNDQDDFGAIAELSRVLIQSRAQALMTKALQAAPESAALIQSRYLPPHDLSSLLAYPQDSLGYCYAQSLQDAGMYPDLYSDITIESDESYVEARLGQTHDIWHLITGFSTSVEDEIGLQAFHLAQFPYPLAAMLIANALISYTLLEPESLPQLLTAVERGWQLGQQAKPLFSQKWEEAWQKPLSQWQAELNLPTQSVAAPLPTGESTRLHIRLATRADIPFVARVQYEASLPPLNYCAWEGILAGTNTDTLPFIEALYRSDACAWGSVSDCVILEENGKPIAGATGYAAERLEQEQDYRLLKQSRLNELAAELSWSNETAERFWQQYQAVWGENPQDMALKQPADWIVEFVAVMPEARGRGLVKPLLNAVIEAGRQQGYNYAGITIINGNERAQRVYESLGFKPYVMFASNYFDEQFPGLTRFRMKL